MIQKRLTLAALCILLVSCNNILLGVLNKDSGGKEPNKFIVIFDKNGGNKEAYPNRKAVAAPATNVGTLPVPPARTDFVFSGWNTEADGSGAVFTAVTEVTENCTVYAQWQ